MAKRLVLDTNVLFSIMKPDSAASYLFPAIRAKLFSPEFVTSELERHKAVCLAKSALSAQEFEMRWNEVEDKISFRGISLYERFLKEALGALPDPDDAPYVALALSLAGKRKIAWPAPLKIPLRPPRLSPSSRQGKGRPSHWRYPRYTTAQEWSSRRRFQGGQGHWQ